MINIHSQSVQPCFLQSPLIKTEALVPSQRIPSWLNSISPRTERVPPQNRYPSAVNSQSVCQGPKEKCQVQLKLDSQTIHHEVPTSPAVTMPICFLYSIKNRVYCIAAFKEAGHCRREDHGVQYFERGRGLTLLKIDRKPNISVETSKGRMVSHLTSRSVCIILPNLV